MTEEEKQAIETVKQYKKCFVFETVHEETGERLNDYSNAIDIVLNLIEKQQREMEEMREELQMYVDTNLMIERQQQEIEQLNEIKQQICKEELITQDYVQDNFIAKDKIREILNKYGKKEIEYAVDFYKEIEKLLEE